MDELLTVKEIAERLKISKYTVYDMIKRREFPSIRCGRSIRVPDSDFRDYLERCKEKKNDKS